MKDFGYYKHIINQSYNPERKALTKEKFYILIKKIRAGDELASKELFHLTCFFAYDLIGHAYAEGALHGDFEEDVQDAYVMLKEMSAGKGPSKKNSPYFSHIPMGTSYRDYTTTITSIILTGLNKASKNSMVVDMRKSQELNELLQNPEDVAVKNISRRQIANFVAQSGVGKHDDAKLRHSQWLYQILVEGRRCEEVAQEAGVSRQAVYSAFADGIRSIHNDEPRKNELKELLY